MKRNKANNSTAFQHIFSFGCMVGVKKGYSGKAWDDEESHKEDKLSYIEKKDLVKSEVWFWLLITTAGLIKVTHDNLF